MLRGARPMGAAMGLGMRGPRLMVRPNQMGRFNQMGEVNKSSGANLMREAFETGEPGQMEGTGDEMGAFGDVDDVTSVQEECEEIEERLSAPSSSHSQMGLSYRGVPGMTPPPRTGGFGAGMHTAPMPMRGSLVNMEDEDAQPPPHFAGSRPGPCGPSMARPPPQLPGASLPEPPGIGPRMPGQGPSQGGGGGGGGGGPGVPSLMSLYVGPK